MSEETLFIEALEIADPAERSAFLDRACARDPALRGRLARLLEQHAQAGSFLGSPAALPPTGPLDASGDSTSNARPDAPPEGDVIGPYKLVEVIGEGGMGTVWLAQQQEPVKRLVALKVIKAGMDSKSVLARFEAERQALALMDHPNIAKVLDAGSTADGRPYFVMELVKGIPITKFCDERRLTPRERLELFVPVCQAVQHAHQKGVIHRDIKPSNVLVALYDGRPVPKVIDFGIAKAAGQPLTEKTLITGLGAVVGTPEYMSPEQAELNQLDIDTRSDVYSLGVLLYELLTGTTPIQRKRLKEAALLEVLRLVREEEPPRPSTRLSTTDELPSIAANRGVEPRKLSGLVRGELDWIVMKALEKDRGRRYETANGFAMDVQRYLADEAVQACPPSAGYRLRKFVRRNKGPVLATSLVLLALVGGIVGTTVGLIRADEQRRAAEFSAAAEQRAKETAEKRLAQIEKGVDVLASIFDNLNPYSQDKQDRPLRAILAERLDQAAAALQDEAVGDPLVVARLQDRLGLAQVKLGYPDRAIHILTRARATRTAVLGPDHADTLSSSNQLGLAYLENRQLDQAIPLLEDILRTRKVTAGPDDPRTLATMQNLATAYRKANRLREAITLHREILDRRRAIGASDTDMIQTLNSLATAHQEARELDKALELMEEALMLTTARQGPGPFPLNTIQTMNNLALGYLALGRMDDARPHFERTVVLIRETLGPEDPLTLLCVHNLAGCYEKDGRPDKALPLFLQAAEGIERRLFRHEYADRIVRSLVNCLERDQQFATAEGWRRKWLAVVKEQSGADSPAYAVELSALGLNLLRQKKWAAAEGVLRDALAIREAKVPDTWMPFSTRSLLGDALLGQEKYPDAEPLLLGGYEGLKRREAGIPPESKDRIVREALERLVRFYEATTRPAEAAKWRKELESLRPKATEPMKK